MDQDKFNKIFSSAYSGKGRLNTCINFLSWLERNDLSMTDVNDYLDEVKYRENPVCKKCGKQMSISVVEKEIIRVCRCGYSEFVEEVR